MAKLKSPTELEALRKSILAERDPGKAVITICNGTGCHAHGCKAVTAAGSSTLNVLRAKNAL